MAGRWTDDGTGMAIGAAAVLAAGGLWGQMRRGGMANVGGSAVRPKFDTISLWTDMDALMDAAVKEVIPGRSPWTTRKETRRWIKENYDIQLEQLAEFYDTSISAARKAAPDLKPYQDAASAQFD